MKLTKRQLRILIEQYVADAEGNVTPPQQYSTDIDKLLEKTNISVTLRNMYHDAFLNIANDQYSIYKEGVSAIDPGKVEGLHSLLDSDDEENFIQGFQIASALELFNDDYVSISSIMKNQMLNDARFNNIVFEISDYLDQAAMSDTIYVDDKPYTPNEFLTAIIEYLTGYDIELENNRYPKGLARAMKLFNDGLDNNLMKQDIFKPLGLQHLMTGKQEEYPFENDYNMPTGFYPYQYGLGQHALLSGAFLNAKSISLGYPASREGKEEYGLGQFDAPMVILYCDIYCTSDGDPDTNVYMDDLKSSLVDFFGLTLIQYDASNCAIIGPKEYFDYAIKDTNDRYKGTQRISLTGQTVPYQQIPDNDYEEFMQAMIFEAELRYTMDGHSAPCGATLNSYEEFYFPGYEREAKNDIRSLLNREKTLAKLLSSVGEETSERIIDILLKHIADNDSWPKWDNERIFPILIATLSVDKSGDIPGLYQQTVNDVGQDIETILEYLISDLQG